MDDVDGGSTKGHAPGGGGGRFWDGVGGAPRRKSRKRPLVDQRFSAYLSFGLPSTICLSVFLFCYMVLLWGLSPLLNQAAPAEIPTQRGAVLRPVVQQAVERIQHLAANKETAKQEAQHLAEHVASAIQKKIASFRDSRGVTDTELLKKAIVDMDKLRTRRKQEEKEKKGAALHPQQQFQVQMMTGKQVKQRAGFMVLGMHRSGTSMLSGLMVTGMGYQTGGPLIGSAFDNEKGFFELVPAVLQNDVFMNSQRIWWSSGVYDYDWKKALDDQKAGRIPFTEGAKALLVLNDPDKIPYLQKDPRMCITLKTWLPLLNSEPAILFTYRHPLEVAKSLQRRENAFTLEHGLRLWIIYNMRAVQNSADLCRVTTSNDAILEKGLVEVQRIAHELTHKCHVAKPPDELTQDEVDKFVDSNMQHLSAQKAAEKAKRTVLEEHNGGDCKVYEYDSELNAKDQPAQFLQEVRMYKMAMKIYCDFASGAAYRADYVWPALM